MPGPAWLASSAVGQLTLLDGSSAEVAAEVQVAPQRNRVDVVQQGANAYAVDRTAGQIRRIDGATFELTPSMTPLPNAGDGLHAFASPDSLVVLDTSRGVLVVAESRTLKNASAPISLTTQTTTQTAALDGDGRLWVLDRGSGDLAWLDNGQRHTRRG